jgi:hypothetical protein
MESESPQETQLPYVDKVDPWSSHAWIRDRLAKLPPGARVLDVGAASGTLGRMCSQQYIVLNGIEPEQEWAEVARPFYANLLRSTLDRAPVQFLGGYQVVVLADVLEHMANPDLALTRLVDLQDSRTVFMISVPNVANLWVRINLLFGRFDYSERGILDRTHLRFFTRRSLIEMLDCCGLRPTRIHATPIPLNLVHPFFAHNRLGKAFHQALALLTGVLPTLLGYQFIVESVRVIDDYSNFTGETKEDRNRPARL